jgi:micrococcal nuclease
MTHATLVVLFCLFSAAPALAFTGHVVGVLDGIPFKSCMTGKPNVYRLHGIDCPEKGQPFGTVAKWATSALVFGRTVTIQRHDTDRYKRVVADIVLADATHVNQKLVKDGWCWWYRKRPG